MDETDVSEIMGNTYIGHPRFNRLIREALERIPLRYEDVRPLRIFLSGYEEAFASSLEQAGSDWYNILVLDLHDLERKDDQYIVAVVAHEIAHVYLGHPKVRDTTVRTRQEEEAKALAKRWGIPDPRFP